MRAPVLPSSRYRKPDAVPAPGTSAAPYRHFAGKRALITAIMETGFEEFEKRMAGRLSTAGSVQVSEQLKIVAVVYVRFAVENPWLSREMYSGQGTQDEDSSIHAGFKNVYRIYSSLIRTGQENEEFSNGDPDVLAGVFWSLMHGMATLVIDGQVTHYARGDRGIEQFVGLCIQTLITGMTA